MNKVIVVKVRGASSVPYTDLVPFQGDLKKLTVENYQKLRDEIVEDGFCEPITVWLRDGQYIILNGHQRVAAIREMVESEKWECPFLPISIIENLTEDQANLLVLALTSSYGEMTEDSLVEFIKSRGLRVRTIIDRMRHPEIDPAKLLARFEPVKTTDEPVKTTDEKSVQFIVSVDCKDEDAQRALFEELTDRGLECHLIN